MTANATSLATSLVQSVDWLAVAPPTIAALGKPRRPRRGPLPARAQEASAGLGSDSGTGPGRTRPAAAAGRRPLHLLPDQRRPRLQLHGRHLRPRHPVPRARRGAAHRAAVLQLSRRPQTSRGRILVPAAVLGRRGGPAACLPRSGDPGHRPRSGLAPGLRPGGPAPRRPPVLRGRAEVLPLLGHRDRRDAARRQLRLRRHRQPPSVPDRGCPHPCRPTARHARPGGGRAHPGGLRVQDRRRALPLLGARHLRRRPRARRGVSVRRR